MLRVVIDTSSLVSYILTRGDIMRRVVGHWRANRFVVLSSPATRAELTVVLSRPQIQRLAVASLEPLIQGLDRYSWHVPGEPDLTGACRDPKDDKFLACAVEGNAHYLVSSDRYLLDMRSCRGVAIVSPGQFLLALELHALDVKAMARRFDLETLADIRQLLPLEPETARRLLEAISPASDNG
jgi:putative PIN family toxin of toxin-antitoxin system